MTRDEIEQKLKQRFQITGNIQIHDDGVVDVVGKMAQVYVHESPDGELGVTFGVVEGHFLGAMCQLRTLKGSPHTVNGNFMCYDNLLSSLEHGPLVVGGHYHVESNNLHSLDGLANRIGGTLFFSMLFHDMPLLRCLNASKVVIANDPKFDGQEELREILNNKQWIGRGKAGAIPCATALIKAGFRYNAKW